MIFVPFAVPAPLASTHSPDCTPVIVPFEFTFHCWLARPLHDHTITCVPLPVPAPLASRHMSPTACNCLPAVKVQAAVRAGLFLSTTDGWTKPYYDPEDLRSVDRVLFA